MPGALTPGQQGVTMKTLTLTIVLTVCLGAGCAQFKPVEAGTESVATGANPQASIIEASKKLVALKSISAIVEGEGKLGIRKDVQFVAPDRYHIKFDDQTGAHIEMINIGNESYILSGDTWSKMPPSEGGASSTFRNNFTEAVYPTITDAKYEGEDTVNGKSVYVYSYKLTTVVSSFPVSHRIWVDKTTGVPIKAIAEYNLNDSQEKYLTTTFDIETPVTIEPPQVKPEN